MTNKITRQIIGQLNFSESTLFNHSHKKRKDILETRAVYTELCILKFTERPKTPGIKNLSFALFSIWNGFIRDFNIT